MNKYCKLTKGEIYTLRGQEQYRCIHVLDDGSAQLQRMSDGYILIAHGTQINPDNSIEWLYSTGGHWERGGNEL